VSPTSLVTVGGLWAFAAAVLVTSIVCWHRLAAGGARHVLLRVMTQVVVVVTAVAAVAGLMNRHYGFYTTWTDLASVVTGTPPVQGRQTQAGASPQAKMTGPAAQRRNATADRTYRAQRNATQASLRLRANPGRTGQFVRVTVPGLGPAAGKGLRAGRVIVWLPPSYTDPAQANRTYPVIEAFHGVPGGPRDWNRVDHLQNVLADAIGKRALGQAIVVMPDFEPAGIDTECVDGGGIAMETWLTKTVPDWTVSHLRVQASPSAWAVMGYSAGGWCAAMAGLGHPDRYSAAILLGAYFKPEYTNWRPFGPGKTPSRYDLLTLISKKPPATNVWIQDLTADPQSGPVSARFVRQARPPLSVTAFTQQDLGHRIGAFVAILPRALTWLGTVLPSFAAPPAPSHGPVAPR